MGDVGKPVLSFLESLTVPVFKLVGILMKAAPLGAFGAIAFTIGKFGIESLVNLAWLVGTFYLTSIFSWWSFWGRWRVSAASPS